MLHYRKTKLTYNKHRKKDAIKPQCPFCSISSREKVLAENDTMFVVPNRVSYDMFEGRRVTDHVMVIPKEHRRGFGDFTPEERNDAMLLIGHYETLGYNVYARGVDSPSRSVEHQHTHLIKLQDKASKVIVYTKKPYVLIDF
ncbi:hypothetical protein D3C73_17320 [compost metagenome]